MKHRMLFAPARPAACALAIALATTMLTIPAVFAQAQKKDAPKAKAQPQQKGTAPQAAGQPQAGALEMPQLIFSPWTKVCGKGSEADAKQVCFTAKDGRLEDGRTMVSAVLIEPEGEPKKILRVGLPIGVSLLPGTRVIVDQGQPMSGPYVICFINGCLSEYEASAELVQKLKRGQQLVVQGFASTGQPIQMILPLGEFAKAYDGPPTDPQVLEAQQKKLQDELERRAEETRKRFESSPGQPR